jgi:peptidoglycan/xylan/chitin deacetylase (PgdA/CDA1 family)
MSIEGMTMKLRFRLLFVLAVAGLAVPLRAQPAFPWPEGKRAALSLSFDDARPSQVDAGTALFEGHASRVTFYLVPGAVEQRLEGWRHLAGQGHEMGGHSMYHPCSANFAWTREHALEDYTLDQIRDELTAADDRLEALLGVRPETYAYPCGQSFVGRGRGVQSYVPLVAELYTAGRGWKDEAPNDPAYVDLPQATGIEMDGRSFSDLKPLLDAAEEGGLWVVLAGHDIGDGGPQTTLVAMLEELLTYAEDPANGIWIAPVGTVARYIDEHRERR